MTLSPDTTPETDAVLVRLWRSMSPARKLELVSAMSRAAQEFSLAGLRLRHPRADDEELRLRLAALRLPREIMVRVFGWDPQRMGY